jgi:hypothetical protein
VEITTERVDTREEQRAVVRLAITAGEPVTYGYRVKRQWRPMTAVVTWERSRDGGEPWEPWRSMNVRVDGRNILASGGMGADHSVRMWSRKVTEHDGLGEVWDAAMRTAPTGDLPVPPARPASAQRVDLVATMDEPPPR